MSTIPDSTHSKQPPHEGLDSQTPSADKHSPRIVRYDQYLDRRTLQVTLRKTKNVTKSKKSKESQFALVVRRIFDDSGKHVDTEIDIKSKPLTEALIKINDGVSGLQLTRKQPVASPKLFFHSLEGLEKMLEAESKDKDDTTFLVDLQAGINYALDEHRECIEDLRQLTSKGRITFSLLWALFPPLKYVCNYDNSMEQIQILQVQEFAIKQRDNGAKFAALTCTVIRDAGVKFGIAYASLEISEFEGERALVDLSVYPLLFHKDKDETCKAAIQRGKRLAAMIEPQCYEYHGRAMREKTGRGIHGEVRTEIFSNHGRIMIDPTAFQNFVPNSALLQGGQVFESLDRTKLTDDQYMICSPVLFGFSFKTKTWGTYAIENLRKVEWSSEPFRALILPEEQRDFIRSLVQQHKSRSSRFDDVVVGKGKGLIGLFSGNPGCGKTLTAEAIAEVLEQPLYVVSAGDLGTNPRDVDVQLGRILDLAQSWDAVLLLDEAEVFLQRRDIMDVARNALVSIFLRRLEYYQGVLIMTTNLITHCDPAFESRIHFSVHYKDLDTTARRGIWETFINKANKSFPKAPKLDEEYLDQLAKRELNGRQIKNIVSNALSVALANDTYVKKENIDVVLAAVERWSIALGNGQQHPRNSTDNSFKQSDVTRLTESSLLKALERRTGIHRGQLAMFLQAIPYVMCCFMLLGNYAGWRLASFSVAITLTSLSAYAWMALPV